MAYAALDLNDSSLVIARDGEALMAGPGVAAVVDGALRFGNEARPFVRLNPQRALRRYWAQVSEAVLTQPLPGAQSSADLVHLHLAQLWSRCEGAEAAILAVTPAWSAAELGLVLGIAQDIGIPVAGVVDSAVAASRRPYPGRVIWHIEAGLEQAWITRMAQDDGSALGARQVVERFGIETLERGCADFVARRFVACSRFDPLHDARSEQALHDRMPEWLALAARSERVALALEHGGNRFEAWLDPVELRAQVARLCEPLTQKLRALVSPREPSVLQVHARLADFPGLIEALAAMPGCTVALLDPAAAARGALRLRPVGLPGTGLRLTTALPWDQAPADEVTPVTGQVARVPTHLVFEGRAWRLAEGTIQVGTDLGESEYGIRLDAHLGGVSRRHCAVQVEDGRAVVHDQSRYGTFLNGHRIEGSAVLHAGDVLSIGQPAQAFMLVSEVGRGP